LAATRSRLAAILLSRSWSLSPEATNGGRPSSESRDGNPAFLEGVLSCVQKRTDILGLHAHGQRGGQEDVIAMRVVLRECGPDPTLTAEEQLVYEAILREGRLPGGAVRLVGEATDRQQGRPEG
jgi:hypothetical protein